MLTAICNVLPSGNRLSGWVWERRHRAIIRVAAAQVVLLVTFGLSRGLPVVHVALESGVVSALAVAAKYARGSRDLRAALATLALVVASAAFVEQAGGATEAHFHFFVMVGLITLYQDWVPFGVAIVFVVLHHGLLGSIDPEGIYGTPDALDAPWRWAVLHGGFVLSAAAVQVMGWRLSEEQVLSDPLTGLANRLGFVDLVDDALKRPEESSVLYLDLDGFKSVNDGHGHDAGDSVLRMVATRLLRELRNVDRVARLGGDEFAVLIPGLDEDAAARVADRMLMGLADPMYLPGLRREVHVTASIGVAGSMPGMGGAELIRRADLAMYSAKSGGRNRRALFTDGLEQLQRERLALAEDLHHAIARDELRMVYQPTIDIGTGCVNGVEALMRWRHPTRGDIPPVYFIPIAEETGTIVAIGDWALTTAVSQLSRWRREGLDLDLAVNVSARQLDEASFVGHLLRVLAHYDVPPQRVVVELTETVLMRDVEAVALKLADLRRHGVRVAIDDFGTGYSSMSYLRRLPVDIVKIDRSFVRGITTGSTEAALVRSIIELASTLDMEVVAEGVEENIEAAALQTLRCPTGQGYLWSRPVEAGEILALVRASPARPRVAGAGPDS